MTDHRVAIVGAGFSGLGLAIRLRQRGEDDFVVLERGDDVGGAWRDNSYPGAACHVPSSLYSYSFARRRCRRSPDCPGLAERASTRPGGTTGTTWPASASPSSGPAPPRIQPTVRHLTVYQRTAPWIVPRHDRALSSAEHRLYRVLPAAQLAGVGSLPRGRPDGDRRPDPLPRGPAWRRRRHRQAVAHWHPPETVARTVLSAIEHDRPVAPAGVETHVGWFLHRLLPTRMVDTLARTAPF